jgi:hypothetical protein
LLVIGVAHRFGFAFATMRLEDAASTTLIWALFGQFELIRSDFGQPNLDTHKTPPNARLLAFS